MGKASKRLKRRQARKAMSQETGRNVNMKTQTEEKSQELQELEKKLDTTYGEKKYSKALDVLAELVGKTKELSPEHIFMGAKSYFELGDYDRAAQWITNTLTFAPAHVEARLLLSRICMMKNRAEDGMAILNLLLANGLAALSEAQQEIAKRLWLRYGEKGFLERFPNLSVLAENAPARQAGEAIHQAGEQAKSDVKDLLRRLKEKVAGHAETAAPAASAPAPAAPATVAPAEATGAAEPAAPAPMAPGATAPAKGALSPDATPAHVAPAPEESPEAPNATEVIAAVRGKTVSRAEKLRILNAFAGAAYLADDCETAEEYLSAALTLDGEDEQTLKNAVYNSLALGEIQRAEAYAARMHFADFAVLDEIRAAKGL